MGRSITARSVLAAVMLVCGMSGASAQVLGTFAWQMQPYCNRITLTLTSVGGNFTLDGFDDQCGATNRASAVGVGTFNASGNLTINFTIVTAPSGKPVHVSAVVSPANGNGTWTDSVGNGGTFAFFAATPGLPPRPLPASGLAAAVITGAEIAPGAVTGASVADGSLTMADVANGPRAAFVGLTDGLPIGATPAAVRTRSLNVPGPGTVIVIASGTVVFTGTAPGEEVVFCSLSTSVAGDVGHSLVATDAGSTAAASTDAFGTTRGFTVSAGPFTVNLVCAQSAGTGANMFGANITAIFVAH
jgi:hypothetical protein